MATDKPNILLIVADDLGIDTFHVDDTLDVATVQVNGLTGSYPLPNISRLIREGVHFTRAWAHPICAPTRATLFTGMHPWRTTIGDAAGNPFLPRTLPSDGTTDMKTLAHMVTDAGYQCAIFGKWDLGEDPATGVPTARGWRRHEGILAGGLRFIDQNPPNKQLYEQIIQQDVRYVSWNKVICDASLDNLVRENITPEERTHKYATADEIYSARDWIKRVEGRPWWVTLSVLSPHDPFHVPPKGTYTVRFQDPNNPTIQEMFAAMMESLDYYLGELFNDPSPEIQNQLRETVIILMGDNGTQDEVDKIIGDDKSTVGIGGVHVPMIIADGGAVFGDGPCYFDADQLSSEQAKMVHIVDVFQTIIDIAGGSAPPGYTTDSISMVPYLKNTAGDARFADWQGRKYNFGQFFVPDDIPGLAGRYQQLGEQATISDGQYKLNYKNGTYEFFELTFDPATDTTTENERDLGHPRVRDLWEQLTTPGNPNYAEVTGKGKKFPPLPQVTPTNVYRYVRLVALSEIRDNPWACVAEFNLRDAAGNPLDRSAWAVTADSQETAAENGSAGNAIDTDQNSFWLTEWSRQAPPHPHELRIDLGAPQAISGFNYLPRQNGENGRIKDYQLLASADNTTWVVLAEGTFPNTTDEQTVTFAPASGRVPLSAVNATAYQYVRLMGLSEVENNPYICVAELHLLDANGNPLDRSAWKLSANSEDTPHNHVVSHAIDGYPSTFWHTIWHHEPPLPPHELRIDMGTAHQLRGFKYLPRQQMSNGRIKDYQLLASTDNTNWVVLAEGTFPNTTDEQTVVFQHPKQPAHDEQLAYAGALPPDPMLDMDHFILHLHGDSYESGDVWKDESGRENHATRADGCTMPTLHQVSGYNGRDFKVMRFDGGGGLVFSDDLNIQAPCTLMIIDRYYGVLKGRTLQSRTVNWMIGKWNGHNGCYMEGWLNSEGYIAEDNVFTIQTATLDENHKGTWYLNGEQTGTREGAPAPGKLSFCKAGYYTVDISEADIAAVLVWTRVLSEQERKSVERWLAYIYGLEIK
jgi:arylsulfatase A-like enzyme